jgi:Xaa-Pro aminopeptidase
MPGHVVTNEPGFCTSLSDFSLRARRSAAYLRLPITDSPGRFGMRIESALAVVRVKVR